MQISNLKTCLNPSLNDVFPLLDIDGGNSGKPILRKTTIQSIIDLLPNASGGGGNSSSGFSIPTTVKTVAANTDYFIGIDADGLLYQISKADLLAGLSSSGGTGTGGTGTGNSGTNKILTYSSNGDVNGLFYWLGTSNGVNPWINPANVNMLATASSTLKGDVNSLCDRTDAEFYTYDSPNGWVKFQILSGKLKCNYYSIRNRHDDTNHLLRNWKLQGSNDDANWTDIDTQVDNSFLKVTSQWLSLPVSSVTPYSYFRIFKNGVNSNGASYLCLSEVELYGEYSP